MCYLTNSEDKNSLEPKTLHYFFSVKVTTKGTSGGKYPNSGDQKMNANEY
jgi:hypothetical protein